MTFSCPTVLSVSLFVLGMTLHVDGCIHIGGLKPLEERLSEVDLVVYARTTAVREINDTIPFKVLDVTVHCVLKNTQDTVVDPTLSIGETGGLSCNENVDAADLEQDYVITMTPPRAGTFGGWAYMFHDINGQGALSRDVNIESLICNFPNASLPFYPAPADGGQMASTNCPVTCGVLIEQQSMVAINALAVLVSLVLFR